MASINSKTQSAPKSRKRIAVGVPASTAAAAKSNNDINFTITKCQKRKPAQAKAPFKPSKKAKAEKDPNEPKRPQTAFMIFMEDFRKVYKQDNPNSHGVTVVAKEGGAKWKSMSTEDKAAYVNKSLMMKEEYQKALQAYKSGTIPQTSCGSVVTDDIGTDDRFDEPDTLSSGNGASNSE